MKPRRGNGDRDMISAPDTEQCNGRNGKYRAFNNGRTASADLSGDLHRRSPKGCVFLQMSAPAIWCTGRCICRGIAVGSENCSQWVPHDPGLAVSCCFSSVAQSDSGGHDEYFFLPKTLAVPDTFTAPSLVGSKEAAHSTRTDQRRLCAAQRLTGIYVCEGRLSLR